MTIQVKIKLLPGATAPRQVRAGDACFDLYSGGDAAIALLPRSVTKVPLGFMMEMPPHHEAQLRPRSGLASRGLVCMLGTIDQPYRGELQAVMLNATDETYWVEPNERIAQMAIRPVPTVELVEVDELSDTDRGTDGFGSSGRFDDGLNSGTNG